MTSRLTIPVLDSAVARDFGDIASAGYIFGYPLVLMDTMRRVMSNFPRVCEQGAPINQFLHGSEFPENLAGNPIPDTDMISSTAWLDLTREPAILSLPDMGKRYHVLQMLDAWTNLFAVLGTRSIGNAKTCFVITGPDWKGSLPLGLRHIKCSTNLAWLAGSTEIKGEAAVLRKTLTHYKLTPLSAWDMMYFPPNAVPVDPETDMTTPPHTQVAQMDAVAFFQRLSNLLSQNPSATADTPIVSKLEKIGVSSKSAFPPQGLTSDMVISIRDGVERGRAIMEEAALRPDMILVNGWGISPNTGRYGTDYLRRAATARSGLGINLPKDTIHFRTDIDSEGDTLRGEKKYVLHFPRKRLPPVKAFWSLTLYDKKKSFVENPIGRYSIGDRDELVQNFDGSLDLYIQHQYPGLPREANWLPAPIGEFNLALRLYWPKNEVLQGGWFLPAVNRVREASAVAG